MVGASTSAPVTKVLPTKAVDDNATECVMTIDAGTTNVGLTIRANFGKPDLPDC